MNRSWLSPQSAFVLVIALALIGCTVEPSSTSPAATPATTPSPALSPSATPGPSPIAGAQVVLTDDEIHQPRWSPDGRNFAVGVGTGTGYEGRVDVYTATGAKVTSYPGGWDVAWLDPDTLVTLDTTPDGPNGIVTIHSLREGGSQSLLGPRGAILGNNHGLVAISSPYPSVAPELPHPPTVTILGHRDATTAPGTSGSWAEGDTIAGLGWPDAWSPDGSFLAFLTPVQSADDARAATFGSYRARGPVATERVRLAAGGAQPAGLAVRRLPGNHPVAVPNGLVVDLRFGSAFSPDDRWLAGLGTDVIVDLSTAKALKLPRFPTSWTPNGDLVLQNDDQTTLLWHPDGTTTSTGLPPGYATYGPVPDEVALTSYSSDVNISGTALVRMAGGSVSVPLLAAGGWNATWAPDGSSCLINTGSDNAQLPHDTLVRVALP